jgi:AcrR family transcriptional regulator
MSRTKSDATRERLLDAATRLIVEHGYHQVGMDEIAREAGVSRQAVYQGHFRSKAELLLALVARADELADVPRRAGRMREARDGVHALDIAIEVVTSIERDIHDGARVFDAARTSDSAFEAAWQDRMRLRRGFSEAAVRRLEAEGRLAGGWTVEEASDFLWASTSTSSYQALIVERGWSEERYVETLKRVLRAALVRESTDASDSQDDRGGS